MSRYRRLVMEFEVEVLDETDVAADAAHVSYDQDGNPGMMNRTVDEHLQQAISHALTDALDRMPGIAYMAGSVLLRPIDGDFYLEWTLPRMPARRDDGTYADES